MQVSQATDFDTHAVIGGGKAVAFTMAETAEFFTVLSDTLYSDKMRAVAREVICNAWDAHIAVGKQDVPVRITLTDEELIFEDDGPGIDNKKIPSIYCRYGASTKAADNNQTGGFGLGSKAPFAYSDHFSATTCFGGKRTVWAISRGSAETEGKPDARPMVSVPTNRTGMSVSIPLHSQKDRASFEEEIRAVVYQGGINATLNDKPLDTIDYTEARKTGYCVLYGGRHSLQPGLHVLYGTVIYRVDEEHRELADEIGKLRELVKLRRPIVLIAPPGSVGVTPSRESLSYKERTISTVNRLIRRFRADVDAKMGAAMKEVASYTLEVDSNALIRHFHPRYVHSFGVLSSALDIARVNITDAPAEHGRPAYGHCWEKALRRAAARKWPKDRRYYRRGGTKPTSHKKRSLLRMCSDLGVLSNLRLFHGGAGGVLSLARYGIRREPGDTLYLFQTLAEASAYMKGKADADYRFADNWHSCLILGRKANAALRAEIERRAGLAGFKIEDIGKVERPKRETRPKTTDKFVSLAQLDGEGVIIGDPKLENPAYFVKLRRIDNKVGQKGNITSCSRSILKHFPDVAVIFTKDDETKVAKAGAKDLMLAIIAETAKIAGDASAQYLYLAQTCGMIEHARSYEDEDVVEYLVKQDTRIALELFPAKVTLDDAAKRGCALLRLIDLIDWSAFECEYELEALHAKAKTGRAIFDKLMVKGGRVYNRFPYLKCLTPIYVPNFKKVDLDDYLAVIQFLKKRHKSQSVVTALHMVKEAA